MFFIHLLFVAGDAHTHEADLLKHEPQITPMVTPHRICRWKMYKITKKGVKIFIKLFDY